MEVRIKGGKRRIISSFPDFVMHSEQRLSVKSENQKLQQYELLKMIFVAGPSILFQLHYYMEYGHVAIKT